MPFKWRSKWRDNFDFLLIAYLLGISILPLLDLIWGRSISAVSSKYNICDSHLLQFQSLSTDNCIIIKITDKVRNPIRSSSKYTENSANLPCLNNSGKMQLDKG
ncbi:hypothetical protein V8E54_011431 [Elaphomyces granulatus]